ncbi:MAG: hypothetical protein WBA93_16325 [Microcoleaceae cyanobacterium]
MLSQKNQQSLQQTMELQANVAQCQPQYLTDNQTCISSDEQLLKNILGRPILQSICDREGNLILELGELISYRAVEIAKQEKVFELLLNSVYYQ